MMNQDMNNIKINSGIKKDQENSRPSENNISKVTTVKVSLGSNSTSKFQVKNNILTNNSTNPITQSGNIISQSKPASVNKITLISESNSKNNNNLIESKYTNPSKNSTFLMPAVKSKRKFTELQKERDQAKREIKDLCKEFEKLYEEFIVMGSLSYNSFSEKFKEILSKESLINFTQLIPESLNTRGACLLENSKFVILYIKFKSIFFSLVGVDDQLNTINLDKFLAIFDYFLTYDQNDLQLLYKFFNDYISTNFKKEAVLIKLQKNGYYEANLSDLEGSNCRNMKHFKFLLKNPETFLNFELEMTKVKGNLSRGSFNSDEHVGKRIKCLLDQVKVKVEENSKIVKEEETTSKYDIINSGSNNIKTDKPDVKIDTNPSHLKLESNNLSKLSLDAQIYYNEMILRNKVDLKVEKSSLSFTFDQGEEIESVLNLKTDVQDKFSICKEEDKKSNLGNNHPSNFETRSSKSTNKRNSVKKILDEEQEEKTAEDIDSDIGKGQRRGRSKHSNVEKSNSRKSANLNYKSKKDYQSDKKGHRMTIKSSTGGYRNNKEDEENIGSSEEIAEDSELKNKSKSKSNKKKSSVSKKSRGRGKNASKREIKSSSPSAKESESDIELPSKKSKKNTNRKSNFKENEKSNTDKNKSRSKTGERKSTLKNSNSNLNRRKSKK